MAAAYTILYQDRSGRGKAVNTVQIAYTTESYSSGLAVSGEQLGCPNVIESLDVYDAGGGFTANFNGGKIRLYEEGTGAGALTEVSGNQTVTVKVIATGW
jgi:hypothetical protein